MTEKNIARADFYTAVVLVAFGITVTVMARYMPDIPRDPYSAPGVLPTFLGVVITGLGLVMLVRSVMRTKGRLGVSGTEFKNAVSSAGTRRMMATAAICLVYAFLVGKISFTIITFFFVFWFIVFFEYDRKTPFGRQIKKLLVAALVAIAASGAITVIFTYLFLVRLP